MTEAWGEVSRRLGRNDLPQALVDAWNGGHLVTEEDLCAGLADAWTMAEWPTRMVDPVIWLSMFRYLQDMDYYATDDGPKETSELPQSKVLYRGAHPDFRHGMSWTEDREKAVWFADRFAGVWNGELYTAVVQKDAILAVFNKRRGENEWVVDPDRLETDDIWKIRK